MSASGIRSSRRGIPRRAAVPLRALVFRARGSLGWLGLLGSFALAAAGPGCATALRVVDVRSTERAAYLERGAAGDDFVVLCGPEANPEANPDAHPDAAPESDAFVDADETRADTDADNEPSCVRVAVRDVLAGGELAEWADFDDVDDLVGALGFDEWIAPGRTLGRSTLDLAPREDAMWGGVAVPSGGLARTVLVGGLAGGYEDASTLGAGCVGWISERPSLVVAIDAGAPGVAISAFAPCDDGDPGCDDLVLVARGPDGTVRCVDDSDDGGLEPTMALSRVSGLHRVWIGTYDGVPPVESTVALSTHGLVPPRSLALVPPAEPSPALARATSPGTGTGTGTGNGTGAHADLALVASEPGYVVEFPNSWTRTMTPRGTLVAPADETAFALVGLHVAPSIGALLPDVRLSEVREGGLDLRGGQRAVLHEALAELDGMTMRVQLVTMPGVDSFVLLACATSGSLHEATIASARASIKRSAAISLPHREDVERRGPWRMMP